MPNKKLVILIAGKKRSGKDVTAKLLQEQIGGEIMSFADPIKNIIAITFGITVEQLDFLKNESRYISDDHEQYISDVPIRLIIQRFGTEAMQNMFGSNVWTDILKKNVQKSQYNTIIVPDFRFKHEFFELENTRVVTVRIKNNNIYHEDAHKSENDLNNFVFDWEIDNSEMNMGSLLTQIDKFILGTSLIK